MPKSKDKRRKQTFKNNSANIVKTGQSTDQNETIQNTEVVTADGNKTSIAVNNRPNTKTENVSKDEFISQNEDISAAIEPMMYNPDCKRDYHTFLKRSSKGIKKEMVADNGGIDIATIIAAEENCYGTARGVIIYHNVTVPCEFVDKVTNEVCREKNAILLNNIVISTSNADKSVDGIDRQNRSRNSNDGCLPIDDRKDTADDSDKDACEKEIESLMCSLYVESDKNVDTDDENVNPMESLDKGDDSVDDLYEDNEAHNSDRESEIDDFEAEESEADEAEESDIDVAASDVGDASKADNECSVYDKYDGRIFKGCVKRGTYDGDDPSQESNLCNKR